MLVGGTTRGERRARRPDLIRFPDREDREDREGQAGQAGQAWRPLAIDLRQRRRPLDDAQPDVDDTDRAFRAARPSDRGAASARPRRQER